MSEFKGTPGPWDKNKYGEAVDAQGEIIHLRGVALSNREVAKANTDLVIAAPELLRALTNGTTVDLPELLEWVADRMVYVYGENANVDFVLTLRHRASVCRAAIAKALGERN